VIVSTVTERLLTTGEAAKAIGVGRATLARWWHDDLVKPELVTAGGHARWDLEDLKRQLREMRERQDRNAPEV
jgi:DNA-binding transcriptional MerR regulator